MQSMNVASPSATPPNHIIDGAVPLVTSENYTDYEQDIRSGGLTAFAPTVASLESYDVAMAAVQQWHALAGLSSNNLRICMEPGDIQNAHDQGQKGIILHFQGGDPIEGSLEHLREFAEAGVRVMQPTYNATNALGAGSLTQESFGLTPLGRSAVRLMEEVGIIPDISHASERTALDTLDNASGVVISSHSNARALYDHPRNISDQVIRAIADHGGVIGICTYPGFLGPEDYSPTADDLIDHAVYIADLVGEQHVSLGLDYADEDEDDYKYFGYDPKYYPLTPWEYPLGIASFLDLPAFADRLRGRGLGEPFVAGLMGNNYARVVGSVA